MIEDIFDNYLRGFFFKTKEIKSSDNKIKKFRKNLEQSFQRNLMELKNNLKDQEKFNEIVSKIISKMNIEDKEIHEDTSEKEKEKESLDNRQQEQNENKLQDKKENEEFLDVDLSGLEEMSKKMNRMKKLKRLRA